MKREIKNKKTKILALSLVFAILVSVSISGVYADTTTTTNTTTPTPTANAGAANATANGSNTGTTQTGSSQTSGAAQNTATCVAGKMLAKLLTSAISSAVGKTSSTITGKTETMTKVPTTLSGTKVEANQESSTNAHTGMFIFGVQTGVSWDSIAYCIVNTIIDYIVNSTIAWANSGFKGNPAFVRNPEQFFKQLADREAASFIKEVAYNETGINVCAPFRVVIATGLAGSYTGQSNVNNTCSLSQMQQNAMKSGKYTITTPTDWIALTKPQNNPYYSYINTSDELSKRIDVKNNTARLDLTINKGFLSYKKCKDDSKPESKTNPCDTVTPGGLIADSLSQTLNIPKQRLVSAQKFDQMVDAIVNNLIKIALSKALEGITGQAPSQAVTSDYFGIVANSQASSTSLGATSAAANGPGGTVGTNGPMIQQILNGARFSNPDWNAYALAQLDASGIANLPVSDASTYFADGSPSVAGYLSIMAAIAQKESGGIAAPPRFHESFGVDSVGLLSLSQEDAEARAHGYSNTDLENPYNNIQVGVEIMVRLIKKYGVLHGPGNTGLSAYWSTFR